MEARKFTVPETEVAADAHYALVHFRNEGSNLRRAQGLGKFSPPDMPYVNELLKDDRNRETRFE